MKLAYSPVAIPTPSIDLRRLDLYMEKLGKKHYTGCWQEAPLCGRVERDEDWLNYDLSAQAWLQRFESLDQGLPPRWTDLSKELLPEVQTCLAQLPFFEITHCNLLLQMAHVPAHKDIDKRYDEKVRLDEQVPEPASYKWLLTGAHLKSFFVQQSLQTPPLHAQFPQGHSLFVITEKDFFHGADYFPEERKYILSIFGLLDQQKHAALLEKSVRNFSEFAVRFDAAVG